MSAVASNFNSVSRLRLLNDAAIDPLIRVAETSNLVIDSRPPPIAAGREPLVLVLDSSNTVRVLRPASSGGMVPLMLKIPVPAPSKLAHTLHQVDMMGVSVRRITLTAA